MASGLFVTNLIAVAILTNGANVQPKNSEASMEVKVLKMFLFFLQFPTITHEFPFIFLAFWTFNVLQELLLRIEKVEKLVMEKDEEIKSLESKIKIQEKKFTKEITKLQTDLVLGKYKNYTTQGMFICFILKNSLFVTL